MSEVDLSELLEKYLPSGLRDDLTVVAMDSDDNRVEIEMDKVLDCLQLAYIKPVEVSSHLLKIRQAICNMAYTLEQYFERTEDAFRVWKAEQARVLNYKDDRNPLIADGSKTTNNAIQSYIREQDEYEEFKNKMSEIKAAKQTMWSAKVTIDMAIDIVSKVRTEVLANDVDCEQVERWAEEKLSEIVLD